MKRFWAIMCVCVGVWSVPIHALAQSSQWITYVDSERSVLVYGVPHSEIIEIMMECRKWQRDITVTYPIELPAADSGYRTYLRLVFGKEIYNFRVAGTRSEIDALVYLEGVVAADILSQIIQKKKFTGKVAGQSSRNYDLQDGKREVTAFVTGCEALGILP